ncbi:tetratricopeptide repeat protein [Agaribacterium haliotis]|uniref:tetratricopeptide repeat protein n=1 Tax=Agaribacterium haliotis TaxID=2013869 RepID=UPI000BB59A30|nr:transglutaminase family protein [Agaribacterium haliotis]
MTLPLKVLSLVAGLSLAFNSSATPVHSVEGNRYAIDQSKLLELSAEIKTELENNIKNIRKPGERAVALHQLMFGPDGWQIRYDFDANLSAQQAWQLRRGNCLSLALLYVASARYVGLKAQFQRVQTPAQWEQRSDYYLVPGHVNVAVSTHRQRIYIEFLGTFYDFEVDPSQGRRISDKQAFADYYNNIAMALMDQKKWPQARSTMQTAIELEPDSDMYWSNLGVLEKFSGNSQAAEKAYRTALKINKRNYSALTNLYVLLSEQQRKQEAKEISNKVQKYSRKNPFRLAKLAGKALVNEQYDVALSSIKKAIKLRPEHAEFHYLQARIYYRSGAATQGFDALQRAAKLAEGQDKQRYEQKVAALAPSF